MSDFQAELSSPSLGSFHRNLMCIFCLILVGCSFFNKFAKFLGLLFCFICFKRLVLKKIIFLLLAFRGKKATESKNKNKAHFYFFPISIQNCSIWSNFLWMVVVWWLVSSPVSLYLAGYLTTVKSKICNLVLETRLEFFRIVVIIRCSSSFRRLRWNRYRLICWWWMKIILKRFWFSI